MSTKTGKQVKLFSKEDVKKAASVDMYEFLNSYGKGELKGGGRYPKYHINGHESIVIDRKKNYFYHNGSGRGDNIIKFLQEYEGYSFPQAVSLLLGEEVTAHTEYKEFEGPELPYEPEYQKATSDKHVRTYLTDVRGIDKDIVQFLFDNGYVVQGRQYNDAVFQWRENGLPNGEIVGATSLVTPQTVEQYEKFGAKKYIAKGSKKHFGFSVTVGSPEKFLFFESHVDLLSYWSMNKDLYNARLICLEGSKQKSIYTFIQETYQNMGTLPLDGVYYGVDNDARGQRLFDFADKFINIENKTTGNPVPNTKLIPYNQQIPAEYYDMYKEISENYLNVSWEMLATVHKLETNMSNDNKLSNEFHMVSTLAVEPGPDTKVEPIDVRAALVNLAEKIEEKEYTIETLDQLYSSEKIDMIDRHLIQEKIKTTYDLYQSDQYEVVPEVGKDWNNYLKEEQLKGLVTSKIPLVAEERFKEQIYAQMNDEFTYYLQDSESKMKIKQQLVDTFNINPSIVGALVQKGLIRQDTNDRIVYLWNDSGQVVGGQIRGTFLDKKAFGRAGYEQKIMDLSQEGYGFNVALGKPDNIRFFQSPEDLLSYWSLNVDQLKDTVLFALSDPSASFVVDAINKKLEAGFSINRVEMCIGNNQSGMKLLDDMSQLSTFNTKNRTIMTNQGTEISLLSMRPKIGVDWLAELHAKKERQERLKQYQQTQSHVQEQRHEQQLNYSRG